MLKGKSLLFCAQKNIPPRTGEPRNAPQTPGSNAIPCQGIQPLSLFAPSEQKSSSPCTGEPRTNRKALGANLAQGSQEAHRKPSAQTLYPVRGYNPSVKTCGFASSPCTGEPRNAPETLGAGLAQGRRECAPLPKGEAGMCARKGKKQAYGFSERPQPQTSPRCIAPRSLLPRQS